MENWYIVRSGKNNISEFLVDKKMTSSMTWSTDIGWAKAFFTKELAMSIAMRYKARLVTTEEAYKLNKSNKHAQSMRAWQKNHKTKIPDL